ncbi:MAG: hypothetical protein KF883_16415 [Thermomicrobiales bacterium]|nr:hypothetical protein [Thermomicrobiales bacterium]
MSEEEKGKTAEPAAAGMEAPPPPVKGTGSFAAEALSLEWETEFGFMPIENAKGEIEATLSYTYYKRSNDGGNRPLTILFNGGPGSASIWLHMGGIGPRRVRLHDDGAMPPPPFEVIDNPHTWLTFSDLVFVDPVDTGYSRASSEETGKRFKSVDGDLELNSEFIRRFISRYNRWSSPLFLSGESYGTFRSAGLAGKLSDRGVIFNGIMLISSVLELGTLLFESGDDLPYVVYVPTYAATAWYHGALEPDLQAMPVESLLREVREWALTRFTVALASGHDLPDGERKAVAAELARYTGIDAMLLERWNLRMSGERFCNELLRTDGKVVGRLDSRFTGFDPNNRTDDTEFDPSMSAIRAPFTAAFNAYVRNELGHETEAEYHVLRNLDWTWGSAAEGTPRTNALLEKAFSENPYLHLMVLSGYYDLATPFFATEYTLGRLRIDPALRDQIVPAYYAGGHMMYVAEEILAAMQKDVAAFVERALAAPQQVLRGS